MRIKDGCVQVQKRMGRTLIILRKRIEEVKVANESTSNEVATSGEGFHVVSESLRTIL